MRGDPSATGLGKGRGQGVGTVSVSAMLLQPCPQVGQEPELAGKRCLGLCARSCRSRAGGSTQQTLRSKHPGLDPSKGLPPWAAPSSVSPAKRHPSPPPPALGLHPGRDAASCPIQGEFVPLGCWVSWGARCGRAVALNQQLDPAVTVSNPRRSLAQAFYAFSSGSRGAWRQRAGETGLMLASREGRGKAKHFPSQKSRGSPVLQLQQQARGEQTAGGAASAA